MNTNFQNWSELLQLAITQPGTLMRAYSAFHNYSVGNQIAAYMQCMIRGIEPGPLNTFMGWKSMNRHVMKGQRAICLCVPLTRKRKGEDGEDELFLSGFMWKPHWFCLSQTEGEPVEMPEIPGWSKELALKNLAIKEVAFEEMNGNIQGYAVKRSIAVSPIAALPMKTTFHELGHVVLGHTTESDFHDGERTPKSLREVEAESVALLLCETLGLPGAEFCRGYLRHWLEGDVIPEKSAMRIMGTADKILKAGRENFNP